MAQEEKDSVEDSGAFLNLRDCTGTLSSDGHQLEVTFHLLVDREGAVSIAFAPIALRKDSIFVWNLMSHKGRSVPTLGVEGSHPNVKSLTVGSAFIMGYKTRTDQEGSFIDLQATAHDVVIQLPASRENTKDRLEYIVAGLESFSVPQVNTPLGTFAVMGSTKVTDHGRLNGIIGVDAPGALDNAVVEDQVERLLDVLSLANGKRMWWSVRKEFSGEDGVRIKCRGRGSRARPTFPLFPSLHLGPAVRAALNNYTAELRDRTGLNVAISWSLMNAQYDEGRFLGQMTALEHLLQVFSKGQSRALIDKGDFRQRVRPALEAKLRKLLDATMASPEVADAMARKLADLNRRTFFENLMAFLEHYEVRVPDLEDHFHSMIQLRNEVVHRGQVVGADFERLDEVSAVLQELLARVFMTLLGYAGPYCSHVDGYEIKQFPVTLLD